jgi:phenylacetate-CoA ligase
VVGYTCNDLETWAEVCVRSAETWTEEMRLKLEARLKDFFAHHPEASAAAVAGLESKAQERLKDVLGLTANVSLLAPGDAPRSEDGKLQRVVDKRTLK